METEKIYYADCHCATFRARVLECSETEGGFAVTLDRTAFYPLGGGQAADTGTLGGVRVLDTREEGEKIVHLCDGPLTVSSTVDGQIDYEARFVRMQQHTGEHIVSGILHRLYGCHNTGFHMNQTGIVIDFDAVIPAEKLPEIEREANEAIWKNMEVPGFDICACCGVHVAATGEIGLIKLLSAIPCRGGTRIEMAAGRAAFDLMNAVFDQNRQVSRLLSAQLTQTAQGAEQLLDTLNGWKYRAGALERQLFAYQAAALEGMGDCFFFADGLNPEGLRNLTDQASAKTGGIAAGFSRNENGFHYCLALPGGDLRGLNKELTAALNGRGGGKPNFQQGSVKAEEREIQAFFAGRGFKKGKI